MVFSSLNIFGQKSFDSLWDEVSKARKERLPKTALARVDDIIAKAEKEKDFCQLVQAQFVRLSLNEELDPDSLKGDIAKMEERLTKTTDPVQKAMLSVLLATTYEGYRSYYNNRDDDTQIDGEKRRKELLADALADMDALAHAKTDNYKPLTVLYDDSKTFFGHDMLSLITSIVLTSNVTEWKDRISVLNQVHDYYLKAGRQTEAALVELKRIQTECHLMPLGLARKEGTKYHPRYIELRDRLNEMRNTTNKEILADVDIVYYEYYITDRLEKLRFLLKAIEETSGTRRQKYLRHELALLQQPSAKASMEYFQAPSERIPIAITYTNVDHLDLEICDAKGKKVVEKSLKYPAKSVLTQHDTVYVSLGIGEYSVSLKGGFEDYSPSHALHIGTISMAVVGDPQDEKMIVHVVDNTTGAPVPNCKVVRILRKGRWNRDDKDRTKTETAMTDSKGIAYFKKPSDNEFTYQNLQAFRTSEDKSLTIDEWVEVGSTEPDSYFKTTYKIFTDRSIYRPGQTIHASLMAYTKTGDKVHAAENRKNKLVLKDVNWRVVDTVTVTTDAYGMASADFTIPSETAVLGNYRIECGDSRAYIKVEEYKRPTFHAEMKPYEGTYQFGDTIQSEGVATLFSGVPVQNGNVEYTIEFCKTTFWSYWNRNWTEVETGEVETKEDGTFSIPVFFDPENSEDDDDDDDDDEDDWFSYETKYVLYRVTAEVTNLAGETQTCSTIYYLSDDEFSLSSDIPSNIDKSKGDKTVNIKASNSKGMPLKKTGHWTIVKDTDRDKVVAEGEFDTDVPITLPFDKMPAGSYVLNMTSTDSKGKTMKGMSRRFTVFSPKEKKMDLTDDWLYCEDPTISPTQSARVYFAPKEKGYVYMHYYLKSENRIIEYRPINGDGELKVFDIQYKDEYADGVSFMIFYVKDGEMHSRRMMLTLKKPEKQLKMEWTTFRDRLRPGQDEEWVLNIKRPDGKPADAHLLATMYDASLDKLNSHSWDFWLSFSRRLTHFTFFDSTNGGSTYLSLSKSVQHLSEDEYIRQFDNMRFLAEFSGSQRFFDITKTYYSGFSFYRRIYDEDAIAGGVALEERALMAPMRASAGGQLKEVAVATQKADVNIYEVEAGEGYPGEAEAQDIDNVDIRTDFSETAFYQPNLIADKDGNVSIAFHLPESLTEWKFMGFANTKDMDYGLITSTAKAQKDFMVQPNMPRFLRDGDKAKIAATVINQTDKAISGTATMLLTDADTGEEVKRQSIPFTLDANATTGVTFDYDADVNHPLLVCKIVGVADGFSDGEQNYLPVLDSRQRILETIPFYVEQGNKVIEVKVPQNTFADGSTDKMTLEYTDTPAWTVIQAIQTLATPREDDAFSYSVALYSNAIARHFVERMPSIRTVIEAWKNDNPEQLTSPLQQNEELRNIVQRETPWMLYADKESEQRARLVELFDDELLDRRVKVAVKKLKELQFASGAWPWFKGMKASSWTTLTVTEHLVALYQHGLLDKETTAMMNKALDWLDEDVRTDYLERQKHIKNPQPTEFDLHYLYLSLVTNHKHSAEVEKIQKYYLDCVEKSMKKDYTIYGWAKTAILLEAAGRGKSALGLMKSLREYTVLTPGQGRHYNTGRALYSWRDYKLPTQIAAMKAMKRFRDKFDDSDAYLHDMQLWLISQKQTQAWDNPLNTVDAVDLLLSGDEAQDEFFHDPQRPAVAINGSDVDMGKMTPGLGYFKTVVPNAAVKTDNTLSVTKDSPGLSWGAVYVQYTAKSEEVGDAGTELKVTRRYLVEEKDADGTTKMRDLKAGEQLSIGQNVTVRLTVTADRDMDFVSLRCQRAACFEPKDQLSGYRYRSGQGYYQSVHDSNTDFFFDIFRRGTCTIDLNLIVVRSGHYLDGLANVQCAYSPSFAGHSRGTAVDVK